MNLALLGADSAMLTVCQAAAQGEHRIVRGVDVAEAADFLSSTWPEIILNDTWESLLAPGVVDGVLVASSSDEELRAEQLRKLVQEGVPLLISHPVHSSMLIYYELDMIRRETQCRMLPYLPARWHPAALQVAELLHGDGEGLGRLEQATVERSLADRSRRSVLEHFARDIDLARQWAGELTHLSALGAGEGDARYANLGVQLSGPSQAVVRWSVRPAEQEEGARWSLQGSGGRAELWMPQAGPWKLDLWRGEEHMSRSFEDFDPGAAALAMFERLLAGEEVEPAWVDACRAVELGETIERSMNKRRTIELHYEDYSEQSTFKGTMTSLGCGLLIAGLFIMLLAAVAGRLGMPWARHWATLLIVLFAGFLALQAMRLLFRKDE